MKKEYSLEELLHKAASYCSISEHCVSEVETKLDAWCVGCDDKSTIIKRLIAEDFINEKRKQLNGTGGLPQGTTK